MQTLWKKTCREPYRRTTLTEAKTRETTDQVLDEAMWEETRPWEEKWESLKVNESKMVEQSWTMKTDKYGFGGTDHTARFTIKLFFWVLIDLIVELLVLIIKPFDDQTES